MTLVDLLSEELTHARGIIADVAHHSDAVVLTACRVVAAHGEPKEAASARDLHHFIVGESHVG